MVDNAHDVGPQILRLEQLLSEAHAEVLQLREEVRAQRYGIAALIVASGGHIVVHRSTLEDIGPDHQVVVQDDFVRNVLHYRVKPPVNTLRAEMEAS